MHSAVQTAVVTIISYKPLSGLNFARYTGEYGSYMHSSPLGIYKPLVEVKIPSFIQCIISGDIVTQSCTATGPAR